MIRTLSRKFIFTSMVGITILIMFLIGATNVINIINTNNRDARDLEMISSLCTEERPQTPDLGQMPVPKERRNEYDTFAGSNFFFVQLDTEGQCQKVDVSRTSQITDESAIAMAQELLQSGKTKGKQGQYIYQIEKAGAITTVVAMDVSRTKGNLMSVVGISLLVGLACWLMMLPIIILLSRKAIRPIALNIERQKQFVTDAGHEIKTPLAIIQSNAEAMELYKGDNKWLRNIKNQVDRLATLTQDMLVLAKFDESAVIDNRTQVNMKSIVTDLIDGFADTLSSKGVQVDSRCQPVVINARLTDMEKLASILVDNAVKYGRQEGYLKVRLTSAGRGFKLTVENDCETLPEGSPEKLFDRFYRGDQSRSQETGGSGIGLSIARSIAEAYGGRITAEYPGDNIIKFEVEI